MRTLSRAILTVPILVALLLLMSPYFFGYIAQKQFNNQVQTLNQQSPYITITPDHYQRHWFSSTVDLVIDFHSPAGTDEQFHKSIAVEAIIKHGPLINVNAALHFAKGALIIQGTTPDFQGSLFYVINWNNRLITSAHIPKLTFNDSNGNTYIAKSVRFTTTFSALNHITHTLTLKNLSILTSSKQSTSTVAINNLMITSTRYQNKGLWLGTAEVFIGTVSLTNNTTKVIVGSLNKLTLNAFSSLNKDQTKLNSLFNFNGQSLTFLNKTVAPIVLSYGIQNVDVSSYKHFITVLEQSNSNTSNNHSTQDMALIKALSHIFESGFTMTINRLYIGLPKAIASSPISIHAQITFNPMDTLAAEGLAPASATGFMDMAPLLATTLIKTIHAKAKFSLPQNLIREGLVLHYANLLSNPNIKQDPIAKTPEALGDAAYTYLINNYMLLPNTDGSLETDITFDKNGALINGHKPALQLPTLTNNSGSTS